MVELWSPHLKAVGSNTFNSKHFLKKIFNKSGMIAGKFKGDKNPGEKFYQRFSKVLFVLVNLKL